MPEGHRHRRNISSGESENEEIAEETSPATPKAAPKPKVAAAAEEEEEEYTDASEEESVEAVEPVAVPKTAAKSAAAKPAAAPKAVAPSPPREERPRGKDKERKERGREKHRHHKEPKRERHRETPRPEASGSLREKKGPGANEGQNSARPVTPERGEAAVRLRSSDRGAPRESQKGPGRTRCPDCHKSMANFASSVSQHRYWNEWCLRHQIFNKGGVSWEEAGDLAWETKERRQRRHDERLRQEAKHDDAPPAPRLESRADRKDQKEKKKRRISPSPDVRRPTKERKPPRDPSSDHEEGHKGTENKALIRTLLTALIQKL